jgi:hypothetical protein
MAKHTKLEIDTAYHEAAHAVAHVVLGHELCSASRVPPKPGKLGGTRGKVLPNSLTSGSPNWRGRKFSGDEIEAIKDDITIILTGDMAEAKLNGAGRVFDANNIETEDDKMIVGRMTSVWPDYKTADTEVARLAERARVIIDGNWGYIERVAAELLEKKFLSGDDVRKLRPIP